MALVVESTSTASASAQNNLVITKPTGVAVGDLLIIATTGSLALVHPSCTGFSTLASAIYDAPGSVPDVYINLLYKIADSSDVSASNYTIVGGGTGNMGAACMFRVSGWSSGNPLYGSISTTAGYQDATSFTASASGLSVLRPTQQLLIQIVGFCSTNSPYSSATVSGYSITSGDSNPTWIEVIDTTINNTPGFKQSLAVAYALSTDTSTITAFSATGATDTGGNEDGYASFLAVICSPNSVTPDISHLAVTPTIESVTASQVNIVADASHLAITPTINGIESHATSPTQWTNQTKPANSVINNQNKP